MREKNLDEQRWDIVLRLDKIEEDRDLNKILRCAEEEVQRTRRDWTPFHGALSFAARLFSRNEFPFIAFLRATAIICGKEFSGTMPAIIIERIPRKSKETATEKEEWLAQMNVQVANHIAKDVELVFRQK